MKHIIRKAFWNWQKEERWLNEQSIKGLALTDYSWCRYVFEDTPPGEYIYRIELLDQWPSHPTSRKYIEFIEETGAECVATYMRWVYYRKKAADGPFEIYSDFASRIAYRKKVLSFWLFFAILELVIGGYNLTIGILFPSIINAIMGGALLILCGFFCLGVLQMARQIRRMKKEIQLYEN